MVFSSMLPVALLAVTIPQNTLPAPQPADTIAPTVRSFSNSAQSSVLVAQSITPGDTSTIVSPTGDQIDITGGQVSGDGANLFHSFEKFGLSNQQTANFIANPQVQNVLGQVLGGDASYIDGILQVSNSDANLYLLNPAGILFGQNARLNLTGSFTATTADRVGFNNGWLDVFESSNYPQLMGDPTQFSFGASQPGSIVNLGNLAVGDSQALTLLGGNVVSVGRASAPGGRVTLSAVNGQQTVTLGSANGLLTMELAPLAVDLSLTALSLPELLTGGEFIEGTELTVTSDGKVVLAGSALPEGLGTVAVTGEMNVSGDGPGDVNLLGQRVALLGATIDATSTTNGGNIRIGGGYQGQGAVPNAEQTYIGAGSVLRADALTSGDAGQVIVWADDTTQFLGEITSRGGANAGDGGFVEVSGRQNLTFVGDVDTSAAAGRAGLLLLDPQRIVIGANGTDDTQLDDGQIFASDPGGLFNISSAKVVEILNNGDVTIAAAEDITVESDIDASGNGNANSLTFAGDYILLNASIDINNNNLTFEDPVFVGSDIRLSTGPAAGDITFQETLNGVEGSHALTLFSGTGDIRFQDAVGVYRNIPGSAARTFQIAEFTSNGGSSVGPFVAIGNLVYFAAADDVVGRELWRSDGSEVGTRLVRDIYTGTDESGIPNSSSPQNLTNFEGTLFFSAEDGTTGRELWRSDGTEAGTQLVRDIYTGSSPDFNGVDQPNDSEPFGFTNAGGTLFFSAEDGTTGRELWRSDGTATGTQLVANINNSALENVLIDPIPQDSNPRELTDVNGTLFFTATNGIDGRELWISDENGTRMLPNINPDDSNFSRGPSFLTNVDGTLFFSADSGNDQSLGQSGRELWRSDGTDIGTFEVADINSFSLNGSARSSNPAQLTRVGNALYFSAEDGSTGRELWISDAVGTRRVADIFLDVGSSNPEDLTDVAGVLYFTANDGANGRELWRINDAGNDVQPIVDNIDPETSSFSGPNSLTAVNGMLFFTVDNGINGEELWRSDGTEDGTQLIANINPRENDFNSPSNLTNVNGTLFFAASNGVDEFNSEGIWSTNGIADPFALGQVSLAITDENTDYAANSLSAQGDLLTTGVNASILDDVTIDGRLITIEDESVVLNALQDIRTGPIDSENQVQLVAGRDIITTTGDAPAPIEAANDISLRAGRDINVGSLGNFSTTSSVTLRTDTGDIQIGYIATGAGGIDIKAAGSFRVIDSIRSGFDSTSAEAFPLFVDFLVDQGYDRQEILDSSVTLEIPDASFSLIARPAPDPGILPEGVVNAPITIEYGDASRLIADIQYDDILDTGNPGRILIRGDSKQQFVIGPTYDDGIEFAPFFTDDNLEDFDPVDNAFPFELVTEDTPYTYPSDEFPADSSGLVAGIGIGPGDNASLYGSLQNQIFESIDDGGGGTGGGGTGVTGGGTGVTGGGTGDGGTGGGSTGGGEVTTVAEIPQSIEQIENSDRTDICNELSEDTVTVSELLTIEEDVLSAERSASSQLVTTCAIQTDERQLEESVEMLAP
ncbi:MAG: ELWxxDGT repeat protein [Cyanobacteria bacterium P01_B01_bin.77]